MKGAHIASRADYRLQQIWIVRTFCLSLLVSLLSIVTVFAVVLGRLGQAQELSRQRMELRYLHLQVSALEAAQRQPQSLPRTQKGRP
jgi:hypothetical protein